MTDPEIPGPLPELPPAYPDRAAWGTATKLRAWQSAALDAYCQDGPRDFLAVATPGAGKTTFALSVAAELLSRRVVERITVVAPTERRGPGSRSTRPTPGARAGPARTTSGSPSPTRAWR